MKSYGSWDILSWFLVVLMFVPSALFMTNRIPLVQVQISNGIIRGAVSNSRLGRPYYRFLGIPYAKPPTGELRFEPPQQPENWKAIRDARTCRSPCIQYEAMFTKRVVGVEDCLYLNVFTPQLPDNQTNSAPLPVVVFIHGGGFFSGNPRMYGPKYFMDEDIVLVTVAYRLGSFGFLNTGDEVIRGNMGLKDQVAALKWVQENINQFSGDPTSVTLMGESSGASAVHLHMLSPRSKGLFSRAISQTGTAFRRYPTTNDYKGQIRYLALRVGCPNDGSIRDMVTCLKHVDPLRIVATHRDVNNVIRDPYATFGPTVDLIKDEEAFLIEEPELLLSSGNYSHVPWIAGQDSADGIIFATSYVKDRPTAKKLDRMDGWIAHLPRLLRYDEIDDLQKGTEIAMKIRRFYFGDGLPSDPQNFQNLTNMFSDRMYFLPTYNAVRVQAPQSPVYLYYFDYRTKNTGSVFKLVDAYEPRLSFIPAELQIARYFVTNWINVNIFGMERPSFGASHGDELFLQFDIIPLLEARPGSADYEASRTMVKAWVDFIKGSSYGGDLNYGTISWPQATGEPLKFLKISEESEIIDNPVEERMKFWKSLGLTFLGHTL